MAPCISGVPPFGCVDQQGNGDQQYKNHGHTYGSSNDTFPAAEPRGGQRQEVLFPLGWNSAGQDEASQRTSMV